MIQITGVDLIIIIIVSFVAGALMQVQRETIRVKESSKLRVDFYLKRVVKLTDKTPEMIRVRMDRWMTSEGMSELEAVQVEYDFAVAALINQSQGVAIRRHP